MRTPSLSRTPRRRIAAALLFFSILLLSGLAAAEELDLGTPRRAVATFLEAAEAGDFDRARLVLDLEAVPVADRPARGRELARELFVVLDRAAWIELASVSDDPRGRPEDGEDSETLARAPAGGREVPIALTRTPEPDRRWLFSASTIARLPRLYEEHGPSALERWMPPALRSGKVWGLAPWQWIALPIGAVIAVFLGGAIAYVLARIATRLAARTKIGWDDELVAMLRTPARFFFAALLFRILLDTLGLGAAAMHVLSRIVGIASIATIAWVAIRFVTVVARWVEQRAKSAAGAADDAELRARGIATQVRVLRRVVNVAIAVIALALMLTQFEIVRNIGVSLLASAGLAGIVLGFAAQRTIGSLIAGIQLSATQPIRIGDVVIIEKEWGTIEEITLTFVVVKVWDERRLIVPMTRFLEAPFENWTKTSAALHGTVFLQADWTLPPDLLRAELARLLEGHPKWDGRTQGVSVTDTKDRTLELRVLVSAANAGDLWDLRVDLREKLVRWLQDLEGGRYLPRLRVVER